MTDAIVPKLTILDIPEKFKKYVLKMNDGSEYVVDGVQKEKIINSPSNFITLPNGTVINKVYIMSFKLDTDRTRENVQENKDKVLQVVKRLP